MKSVAYSYKPILPYKNQIILNEISSDTIFKLSDDLKLTPVACHSPSLPEQDPPGFLLLTAQTNKYTFFRSVISEYNDDTGEGFPSKEIVFDRETRQTYFVELRNNDYETDLEFEITSPIIPGLSVKRLHAYELVEALENGKLKGKLKEIASTLNADDNMVLMVIRYKE